MEYKGCEVYSNVWCVTAHIGGQFGKQELILLYKVIFKENSLSPDYRVWHFSSRSWVRKARVVYFQVRKIIFRCGKIFVGKAQVPGIEV